MLPFILTVRCPLVPPAGRHRPGRWARRAPARPTAEEISSTIACRASFHSDRTLLVGAACRSTPAAALGPWCNRCAHRTGVLERKKSAFKHGARQLQTACRDERRQKQPSLLTG